MERNNKLIKFKLFGLFNIFDILVFILILVVGFYFLKPMFSKNEVVLNNYLITMKLTEISPEIAKAVKKGDRIIDKSGRYFGSIIEEPKIEPSKKWVETSDGRVVIAEEPVLVDITAKFTFKSRNLKYGKDYFKIGGILTLESDYWTMEGVVIDIERKD
ncbi:MAG: hypothetical protein DRI28_01160 [Caldiserica bacterium]|nr:MAG: hypothetical protein DRI28_01160 [Caldisericota bacterium]